MIAADEAAAFVAWLRRSATIADDPADPPPLLSADPGDDYLLALAASQKAMLVSGDGHPLALAGELPIRAPSDFLSLLAGSTR